MALWTDIIDPATLTGYIRESLDAYEVNTPSLARYLPNSEVADIVVRFLAGTNGLTEVAKFRAYDAEPEVGAVKPIKRVTLELPALGKNIPIGEYDQLRARNATEDQVLKSILKTTDSVVRGIAGAIELLRGTVLNTGKATIAQTNFASVDDFGRPSSHTVTAATPWSDKTVSRLADIQAWCDVYLATNGINPGSLVMSTRVFRALASGNEFQTQLLNGAARPSTRTDVDAIIAGAGLPPIELYDRRVNVDGTATRVLPDDKVLMLPAPVDPNSPEETELGATFWGQTLTSAIPEWEIEPSEQPGIVAGVYRNDRPPAIAEVISDAIALPVLANAELSFSADVL
jgi:hypothetical protein